VQKITPENVTIAVTRNLAFFAMLSKSSMDSKWCFLCQSGFKEWACINKQVNGLMWTHQALIDKYNAHETNANMNASDKQGVHFIAILDVDPSLFIPPPLHIKLGLVNQAFIEIVGNRYFSWCQSLIKNIPLPDRIFHNLP